MLLFDEHGSIKRYDTVIDILRDFYNVRLRLYAKRKEYMQDMLDAQLIKLVNIARFITEFMDATNFNMLKTVEKAEFSRVLNVNKFDSDPVAVWRNAWLVKEHGNLDEISHVEEGEGQGERSREVMPKKKSH